MTYITRVAPRWKRSILVSMAMVVSCFVLLLVQSSTVHAQWATNGTNINNTNTGNVGIGTTAPDSLITVNANTSGLQAPGTNFPGTIFHLSGVDNSRARLLFDGFGFGAPPQFTYRFARGTAAAPSAVQAGDFLGQITAGGYKATGYTNGSRATINFVATENWTDNANGTAITFFTNPNGLAAPLERLRIDHSGNIGIGTFNPVFDANVSRYLTLDGGPSVIGSIGAAGGTINPGTAVAQMAFINSTLATTDKRLATIVGSTEGSTNSGVLDFYTASGGAFSMPRLRITSGGNIGVGTMSPGYRLDVQGGAINASGGLCIAGDCKTAWSQVGGGGGGGSQWTTAGANIFYNTGSVGIGTNAPSASLLHLQSSANAYLRIGAPLASQSAIAFNDDANGQDIVLYRPQNTRDFSIWTATFGNVFNVTQAGNVGIGTGSPTAQLHIAGANGPANNTAAPAPDAFRVVGGIGGNGSWGGSQGGVGGGLSFVGGTGGTPVAGSQTALGGKGGSINLVGGNGGPNIFTIGGGAGGDVSINGGSGVANSDGNIALANLRGNVGIGTANPARKLEVAVTTSSGHQGVAITNTNGRSWWLSAADSTGNGGAVNGVPSNGFALIDWTAGATRLAIGGNGNVGIGMTNPIYSLDVNGGINSFRAKAATTSSSDMIATFENASGIQAVVRGNGNVGLGTLTPTAKLDVVGNLNATGTISGGNIVAKYQDVAEWVHSSQELPAATVVVLDQAKSNYVIASSQAYDTRVAGVISSQPGITLGENGAGKVLVATTGRVRVKVDAGKAPVRIGDLLVTSDREGFAMKSEAMTIGKRQMHMPGTLIGKALEPLASGTGEILVLLSLQ